MARQLIVEILGDASKYGKTVDQAVTKTDKFRNVLSGVGQGIGITGFLSVAAVAGKVVDVLGDSVEAALAEEDSIASLGQSLRANVRDWDGNTDAIERVLKSRMRLGFSDDEQRESLARLVAVTRDVEKALDMERTAMDLARFKKISLAEATSALTKMEGGQFRGLKDLIGSTKDITNANEALAAVQRVASGAAETLANTNRGKLAASNVAVGEAMETLGGKIMPLVSAGMTTLAGVVTDAATAFDVLTGATEVTGEGIQSVIDKAGDLSAFLSGQTILNEQNKKWREHQKTVEEAANVAAGAVRDQWGHIGHVMEEGNVTIAGAGKNWHWLAAYVDTNSAAIAGFSQRMTTALAGDVSQLITGYWNPIIAHDRLMANQAEIADLRRAISSGKLTKTELRESKARLHALTSDADQTRLELLKSGDLSAKDTDKWLKQLAKRYNTSTGDARFDIAALIASIKRLRDSSKPITLDYQVNYHSAGKPKALAAGGPGRGMTWVGEDGPELVDLPAGSYVHSTPQSMSMASGGLSNGTAGGGGVTVNVNGNIYGVSGVRELTELIRREMALGV